MDLPNSVVGFTVIPALYPSSTHIFYARPHVVSKKTNHKPLPEGRTLFLVNIPPDATERELVLFFKHCGTVEQVIFDHRVGDQDTGLSESESEDEGQKEAETVDHDDEMVGEHPQKRRKLMKDNKTPRPKVSPLPGRLLRTLRKTGGSAHIVFLDSSSVDRALSTAHKPRPWPTSTEEPSGLAHYTALYDSVRPPLDAVREYADSSIALYEYELAKTKQKSKYRKGDAIVDEDGFTLVTRGGAYGQTLGGGVRVASKRFQQAGQTRRNRTKKKAKEKEGFYSFHRAEKQRKELMELKKNWEADKAKVEKLKESRQKNFWLRLSLDCESDQPGLSDEWTYS